MISKLQMLQTLTKSMGKYKIGTPCDFERARIASASLITGLTRLHDSVRASLRRYCPAAPVAPQGCPRDARRLRGLDPPRALPGLAAMDRRQGIVTFLSMGGCHRAPRQDRASRR